MGRSTKKAAKALLARVLLTRAQYEEAGSAEQRKFYEEALAAALDVVNNKATYGIQLYDTYDEIWQARNNKNNTEFLWVTTFSSNSSLNADSKPNRLYRYFSPKLVGNAGIRNTATQWEYPSEGTLLMPTYYFLNLWEDWDARYDVLFQEEFPENASKDYTLKETDANKYLYTDFYKDKNGNPKKIKVGETALKFTKEKVSDQDKKDAKYIVVGINDVYATENVNSYGGAPVRNFNADPTKSTQYIAASFPRFMKYRIWDRDLNVTLCLLPQTVKWDMPMFP